MFKPFKEGAAVFFSQLDYFRKMHSFLARRKPRTAFEDWMRRCGVPEKFVRSREYQKAERKAHILINRDVARGIEEQFLKYRPGPRAADLLPPRRRKK